MRFSAAVLSALREKFIEENKKRKKKKLNYLFNFSVNNLKYLTKFHKKEFRKIGTNLCGEERSVKL